MRQLKISKQSAGDEAGAGQTDSLPIAPASEDSEMTRYIVSVVRQYQNQGLSLARLIEIGEEAWQWAQLHYAEDDLSLGRWGTWWIRQRILQALASEMNNYPPPT